MKLLKQSSAFTVVAATAAFLTSIEAGATELLLNGGFESGLTSWSASANVADVASYLTISPYSGSRMVATPALGFLDANLQQGVDFTGFDSATLSFAYNLLALDISLLLDLGVDSFQVSIGSDVLYSESLNDAFGGGVTSTGWLTQSIPVPASLLGTGPLQLGFNVENVAPGDIGQNFVLLLDNVSINGIPKADGDPVPVLAVPDGGSTFGLLALGAFGFAGVRRIARR